MSLDFKRDICDNENWVLEYEHCLLSSEIVSNSFKIFRQDATLCDVDLISGDTVVKAHRVVLAAASIYFETLFKSGTEESDINSVSLPFIPPDVLPLVVDFIYTGQTVINSSTVIHLADAARMLQLDELSAGCVEYYRKQLHPSNIFKMIRFAETYNLVQLSEEALFYALRHWKDIQEKEEFVHLSLTMLLKLLTSDSLMIDNEVQVLHAALRWIDHDPPCRRKHCSEILRQMRLRKVSSQELEDALIIVRDPAITEMLKCFIAALAAANKDPRQDLRFYLYVVGGMQSRTALMFDGRLWTKIAPTNVQRCWPGVTAMGGLVYAVGGRDRVDRLLASGEVYDPRTDTWTPIAPMREPRSGFALAAVNDKLYAFGGVNMSSIEAYDPVMDEWAVVGEMPEERWSMSVVTHAGKAYLVGGRTPDDDYSNDVLRYAPARAEWRRMRPLLPGDDRGRVHGAAAAVRGRELYVVGGKGVEYKPTKTVICYNLKTEESHLVSEMSASRAWGVAGVLDGVLVVAGGQRGYPDSVEMFDLTRREWKAGPHLPVGKVYAGAALL